MSHPEPTSTQRGTSHHAASQTRELCLREVQDLTASVVKADARGPIGVRRVLIMDKDAVETMPISRVSLCGPPNSWLFGKGIQSQGSKRRPNSPPETMTEDVQEGKIAHGTLASRRYQLCSRQAPTWPLCLIPG